MAYIVERLHGPPRDNPLPPLTADEPVPQKASLQPIGGLRPKLLYERYGILENPFGVTSNPRYLYQSRTHAEAGSSLIIGIESGVGFQALIAPPGMGKTTILFDVLERFNKVARTAFLFQIHDDSRDFLRYLLSELGSEVPDSSVVHLQEAINQLLVREFRSGRRTIIVIDEAQSLDTALLETIRLLSNFETRSEKLLQIILAGQPQLAQRLANPEMVQLQQRISILTTLISFDLEDTSKYIEHRLKVAGYQGPPLFTSAALTSIWKSSRGVPREINTLCFNAMLLASTAEQKQVDSDILHEVVADLDRDRLRSNTEDADEVDLDQSGTTAAEIASTSAGKNADQVALPRAGKDSDDIVGGTFVPDRPALATHCKTDVRLPGARLGGLPRCETKPKMRQNFREQQLGAIAAPRPRDRFDQQLVGWFALHGGVWCGTAAELLAALKTRVDVGNDLWPQSPRALYVHIESHRQLLRSLGVDVLLQQGYPRMIWLRSCQHEKPAKKTPSGSSGINRISDPAMNCLPLANDQKTSAADSDEVSPAANEAFRQEIPMAESGLAERFVNDKYADGENFEGHVFENPTEALLAIAEMGGEIREQGLDLKSAIELLVGRTQEITRSSGVAIGLLQPDGVVYAARAGAAATMARELFQGSLFQSCLRTSEALPLRDAQKDPLVGPTCRREGIRSLIIVPILHGRGVGGAMELFFKEMRSFSTDDLMTLELITDVVSEALNGAGQIELSQAEERESRDKPSPVKVVEPQLRHTLNKKTGLVDGVLHPFRATTGEETSLKTSPNPELMVLGLLASKLAAAPTLLWLALKRAWMRSIQAM